MTRDSLWRNAGPLVLGRAVSATIGIVLPAVLARVLDQGSYGTYKQLFLVGTLALNTLQFGLAQSLFYFVPRAADEESRRALLGQTQLLLGAIGAAAGLALALAAPLIGDRFSNPQLAEVALPMGLMAGTLIASSPLEIALTARGRPASSAAVLVSTEVVRVGAMMGPILLGHGVRGLAWGAALAGALRLLLALVVLRGTFAVRAATLRTQLHYALPYGASVLLSMPQQQLHQLFVAGRVTPEVFALYAVGCMQIPVVGLLYTPVSETLQVRLAALERTGRSREAGRALGDAVERLALLFLPLCAFAIATAEPVLRILYGENYVGAATILRIGVASVAIAALPLDGVLKARARTGTLMTLYAAKLAVTWPGLVVGFRLAGMPGAIGAHVAIELAAKGVQLAIVRRELGAGVAEILGGPRFVRSAAIAIGLGAVGIPLTRAIANPWLACAAVGAIGACTVGLEGWSRRGAPDAAATRRGLQRGWP